MVVKQYNPTTAGRRQMTGVDFSVLTGTKPEKSLTKGLKKNAGRNNLGRITTRHQGGGAKRSYRSIDFGQNKLNIPAKVLSLEYDPNRTVFIALIVYRDGEKRYILAPQNLKVGDEIVASENAPLKTGNRLMLKNIPVGTFVYNVELFPGQGGKIARSAGNSVQIMAHESGITHLLMPSKEIRTAPEKGFASIGALSNSEWNTVSIGKAGRSRYLGIRPTVRASAMNPRDHKYGGGEGRAVRGTKRPKTKWGKITGGRKTRNRKKLSNKFILRRRI